MKFLVQRPKIWHRDAHDPESTLERVAPGTTLDLPEHVVKQLSHAGVPVSKRGPKAAVHEEEAGEQQ